MSSAGDWRRAGEAVGAAQVVTLTQVHGREVVTIRRGSRDWSFDVAQDRPFDTAQGRPTGDALISNDPGIVLAVRAADCVPLLLADPRTGAVGAVHAGWRGTAAGVATAAVDAFAREFGAAPSDLVVAMGPSIGACCYEVGTELVDAFAASGHPRHLIDRWFLAPPPRRGGTARPNLRFDLAGANRDQLILAGIREKEIHLAGLCTAMHLEVLTPFRAEKEKAERIAGVIRCRA